MGIPYDDQWGILEELGAPLFVWGLLEALGSSLKLMDDHEASGGHWKLWKAGTRLRKASKTKHPIAPSNIFSYQ